MNFREVLSALYDHEKSGTQSSFDARWMPTHLNLRFKEASRYLRRLYFMGFLKRKRVRRLCFSGGKSFKRGYMYSYSLSKQGRSYVTWLRRGKPIEDVYYTQLTYQVNSCLPEELRDHLSALSLIRSNRRYRGPVRNLRLFDNSAVPVACLILQNQSLASENQSVSTENLKLAVDNLKLRQMVEKEQSEKNALLLAYAAAVAEAANSKNTAEQWKRIAEEYFKALQSEKENTQKISPPKSEGVHTAGI